MKNPEKFLKSLRPEKLQTVINDARLRAEGYTLLYAIDPFEVFNFCFPLHTPGEPETNGESEIEQIVADQAALYEVCFKHKESPLLVGHYVEELNGLMSYAASLFSDAYDAAQTVNTLMLKGGVQDIPVAGLLPADGEEAPHRALARVGAGGALEAADDQYDMAEAVQVISEKFHIVLAVAMGIYSLGGERFRHIYRALVTEEKGLPESHPELWPHFKSYRKSGLADEILGELTKSLSRLSEADFRRRRRSAYFDALAIDQLIQVNTSLIKHGDGPRTLVLYLSSAHRTETAFSMDATRARLPQLNGRPFDFHRDRYHIFHYLSYRSARGDIEETIRNLERVRDSVEELNKLKGLSPFGAEFCSTCVLGGGHPNHCELIEICSRMQAMVTVAPLEQRNTEIRNLGLTQTLGRYKELMNARPAGASQEKLMSFFRRVFEDQDLKAVARQKKVLEKEKLIFLQSIKAKLWSLSRSREVEATKFLRWRRDAITGAAQYLPLKPKVRSPKYERIVAWALNYYKTPPQGDAAKIADIDSIYRLYLDREDVTTDLDPEHELVRCLLYLAFPTNEGDKMAYEHALEMLEESDVLKEIPDSEAEFRYIACWAARRLMRFAEANEQARVGIEKWPEDARFYHGRSLSKLSEWAEHEDRDRHERRRRELAEPEARARAERRPPTPPVTDSGAEPEAPGRPPLSEYLYLLNDAEADALLAVKFYSVQREENRDLIGANYNNLAYLHTVKAKMAKDRSRVLENLTKGRAALIRLKEYVPEEEWTPTHPNYFHTEAMLEYYEAINNYGGGSVEHAQRQIRKALELVPNRPTYLVLSHDIDNALNRLRR